jgi:uncharacterized protein YdcH (DUF465 family)
MFGERHDLHHEFPEFGELIHQLLGSNQEFAQLFKQYDDLDAEILDLEQKGEPVTDEVFEEMKFRRVELKDRLYAMLREHAQ